MSPDMKPSPLSAAQVIQSSRPLIIAHRGYSKLAPENTLPAFRRGMASRADFIELDYHLTQDGIPAVLHDHTLDRTTDAKALWGGKEISLRDHRAADLARLDAGQWFAPAFAGTRLPTLKEALDLIQAGSMTLIERKAGEPRVLMDLLRAQGVLDRVVVQSFDWEFVRQCRPLEGRLVLGALGPPSSYQGRKLSDPEKVLNPQFIDAIQKLGAQLVVWNAAVTRESVSLAHQAGLRVWIYTIDDPAKARDLVALGVNGLITNDPETIRQALDSAAIDPPDPAVERALPHPLPGHPGNIYLEGEPVEVEAPAAALQSADTWRLRDIEGKIVGQGGFDRAKRLGVPVPGVGWYRVDFLNAQAESVAWTSAAVLAPLRAPTPADSPVGLDMAVSWFARGSSSNQQIHANLAALAGANWVRDRLTWREVQTGPDQWAPRGNYDEAADIQKAQGLRVLQVFHTTPPWAGDGDTARFAPDLRRVYGFARAMGRRFVGRVQAWEPWNEPNVDTFGSHTMDEICAWQKAAWLGFKAADPKLIVGSSALAAVPTWQQTEGVLRNEARPYFDTYNIHTYDWAHGYRDLWEPARAAAGGKPLWITEADRGATHDKTAPWFDLSPRLERLKAEYVAQSYASALAAGADRFFQFILGHYVEPSSVQFGLLRLDYTPRPAYAALAAAGRFLAGARILGRWRPAVGIEGVAFQAFPDGIASDVLVLWCEREADWAERGQVTAPLAWPAALKPTAVFDFMGRSRNAQLPAVIGSAPLFVLLPRGQAAALPLEMLPRTRSLEASSPSRLVLQSLFPPSARVAVQDKPWSGGFAYAVKPGNKMTFTLCAYNFGESALPCEARLEQAPAGWSLDAARWTWTLEPQGRATAVVELSCAVDGARDGWVVLRGSAPPQPEAALAFRVVRK